MMCMTSNKVYHAVYNFCVVAMSNFYLDVTKDRLYCTNGLGRKAAQTTMYKILVALDKIIAPILCFTSQEIWDFLPKTEGMNKYVVFEEMPKLASMPPMRPSRQSGLS